MKNKDTLFSDFDRFTKKMENSPMSVRKLDAFYDAFMTIDITDTIGYRIARIFRFAGESPISVSLHSMIVMELVKRLNKDLEDPLEMELTCLYALMHDAHESCTTDIPTPVAKYLNKKHNKCIESLKRRLDLYLYKRCFPSLKGIPLRIQNLAHRRVELADQIAFEIEEKWLKNYRNDIRYAKTNFDMELVINKLIVTAIEDRYLTIFQNVNLEPNNFEWTNPSKMHSTWEDCVRRCYQNLIRITKNNA